MYCFKYIKQKINGEPIDVNEYINMQERHHLSFHKQFIQPMIVGFSLPYLAGNKGTVCFYTLYIALAGVCYGYVYKRAPVLRTPKKDRANALRMVGLFAGTALATLLSANTAPAASPSANL